MKFPPTIRDIKKNGYNLYVCIKDCRFFEDTKLPCVPINKKQKYLISDSGYICHNEDDHQIAILISKVNPLEIDTYFKKI